MKGWCIDVTPRKKKSDVIRTKLNVRIPIKLDTRLEIFCAINKTFKQDVVTEAIEFYLDYKSGAGQLQEV